MVNTLMTNNINVKNHPSHTQTHSMTNIVPVPRSRSFVCVYGFKCCWQVKINPTLLFTFLVPFQTVHFSLPILSHSSASIVLSNPFPIHVSLLNTDNNCTLNLHICSYADKRKRPHIFSSRLIQNQMPSHQKYIYVLFFPIFATQTPPAWQIVAEGGGAATREILSRFVTVFLHEMPPAFWEKKRGKKGHRGGDISTMSICVCLSVSWRHFTTAILHPYSCIKQVI